MNHQEEYIEVGKIVALHALHGAIKVQPWCDSVQFLSEFAVLYTRAGKQEYPVESIRDVGGMAVVKFAGVDTPQAAAELRGQVVYIRRADAVLAEGEYFMCDLIGLRAVDADTGDTLGEIIEVSQPGANDVYHVRCPDGREVLVPAIKQVIINTDVAGGVMYMRPMKGIFDDED